MKTRMDSSKGLELVKDGHASVKRLAVIGAGKLGEGLLSGVLGSQLVPVSRVVATVAHQPRADYIAEKYGIKAGTNNREAVSGADLVLICLKPTGEGISSGSQKRPSQGCAADFGRGLGHQ